MADFGFQMMPYMDQTIFKNSLSERKCIKQQYVVSLEAVWEWLRVLSLTAADKFKLKKYVHCFKDLRVFIQQGNWATEAITKQSLKDNH